MTNITIQAGVGFINLSPDAFQRWAEHFYKAKRDFVSPHKFSPVPYFLCCRAIELELKAIHLVGKRQHQVKDEYGHNLVKSYDSLDEKHKILNEEEYEVLKQANEVYSSKGFEYINLEDALTAYKRFPNIDALDLITNKLLNNDS